jgi:hypothetical protein
MQKKSFFLACAMCLLVTACASSPSALEDQPTVELANSKVLPVQSNPNLNLGLMSPLIGVWDIQDWQLQQNGEWQEQSGAVWRFYPIQGGSSLEDHWVSKVTDGDEIPGYGTHLRVYEPLSKTWQSVWLSSRTRNMEFYSGEEKSGEVIFVSQGDGNGRLTRTVFNNISPDFFNWRVEWSKDAGESWLVVYKVNAIRKR